MTSYAFVGRSFFFTSTHTPSAATLKLKHNAILPDLNLVMIPSTIPELFLYEKCASLSHTMYKINKEKKGLETAKDAARHLVANDHL